MALKDLFKGKSDGIAYEPTRGGAQPMMKNGRPVLISELSKQQRKGLGMDTTPAPRGERKSRTGWGSSADFKKAKGR